VKFGTTYNKILSITTGEQNSKKLKKKGKRLQKKSNPNHANVKNYNRK
jgi:hypothetical protein